MSLLGSRRDTLSGILAFPFISASPKLWAAPAGAGNDLLERLRTAKSVTVGAANFPPYSAIELDGSVTGIVPALGKLIMSRLGVPEMKGVAATFGELIPGLQARRWDFICTALTITKARCGQVLFADPVVFDGPSFVSLKGVLQNPPKRVADLAARKLTVGVSTGGAISREAVQAGISPDDIRQLPDNGALIDALVAGRIQIAFQDNAGIKHVYEQRHLPVDVTFPIEDAPEHGSSCAFRQTDVDLHAAFQKELRAMKTSGEYIAIARQYGFNTPPNLIPLTAEKACATTT